MKNNKHILLIGGFRPLHKKLKALNYRMTLMITKDRLQSQDFKFYHRIIALDKNDSTTEWINCKYSANPLYFFLIN